MKLAVQTAAGQRLGGLAPGPYAHLWVSDTGTGMDAAVRERIFEPFFTTKPVGKSTGLGLSVVHGIMAAHHGAVAVDSEPGQGQHVLYVDDDETMVMMVERMLERSGYRVSGYHDPEEALAAVRARPDAFDFVVTDYNMPMCSGLDVAQELARLRPRLPVVISSGYITDELRAEARLAGVRGLLEKQNTFRDLGNLVGRILSSGTGLEEGVG